ncbi:3-hydroxyacyl-CoA dehydrogenase [Aspergillus taichungensis]|uniref:3-hydroxyacyl-CoA dehydrogenase n=1 Tax=Aspergillus taichungensis TaxID=482145 RepID=A0A2J5HV15_9EURO|nr:3-hydroxyacyl-CoA dehydrogenase [Aspergillus taichungensis]
MLFSSLRTLSFRGPSVASRAFSTSPVARAAEVKSLGVIGAGQMGLGIALVAAQKAQVPVTLVDNSQGSIDKGLKFADKLLEKDVAKERLTREAADIVRSRITPTLKMDDLSSVDFVIEAVPEIPDLKTSIFSKLAQIAPKHAILATNTSSISITKIAAATTTDPKDLQAASRVISTHFMNPVPIQKGVEIISGLQTSQETIDTALKFMERMGKVSSVSADSPGFLANRILMPYINEAIICLETGVGGREDIDNIMKNGTNVPMGPLTLADFIGLDTCLAIMNVLHQETGDSKYRPSGLLKRMVEAGWKGRKAGKERTCNKTTAQENNNNPTCATQNLQNMSKQLQITLSTSLVLAEQLQSAFSAPPPSSSSPSGDLSAKDALPLLSAAATELKSQVTKLSLLTITSPFTHTAVTSVLATMNESVLPSLVTAALLVTPSVHTKAFRAEVESQAKTALREVLALLKEVQTVAGKNDAATSRSDLSQTEKEAVTVAAGRVWDVCDALVDIAAKGVVGFVVRRVEEWRDLVRDAVEEIEEWDPDEEGDEFFDEILSDKGDDNDNDNDDDDDDEDSENESNAALHEQKKTSVRILKPVAQIYPAIVKHRLGSVPELSSSLAGKLELLMQNLQHIPGLIDEVAGALYEENTEKCVQYLVRVRNCANKVMLSVEIPWDADGSSTGDKFTAWSRTWLKVMDEVSKPILDSGSSK